MYRIVEVYYDETDKVAAWSNNTANILVWANLSDLKTTVDFLSGAFQKLVLVRAKNDELIEETGS